MKLTAGWGSMKAIAGFLASPACGMEMAVGAVEIVVATTREAAGLRTP